MASWYERLFRPKQKPVSRLRSTVAVGGSMYRISDLRTNSDIEDIRTQILVMRALARDSQVSTALSYYVTDATTPNTAGMFTHFPQKQCVQTMNSSLYRCNIIYDILFTHNQINKRRKKCTN
jgi:hypothetical protein